MTLDRPDGNVNVLTVAVTFSTYLPYCDVTFQIWVAQLIKQRFGTATALAAKLEMQLSPFTRGVALGKLNLVNLLKLAQAADEHPSIVLRLAGKAREAELLEAVYGAAHEVITASEREVLTHWRQVTPRAREGLRLTISELPRVTTDPIRYAQVSELDTAAAAAGGSSGARDGRALAEPDAQTPAVPNPPKSARGQLLESFKQATQAIKAREARTARQHATAPRARGAGGSTRARKPRR